VGLAVSIKGNNLQRISKHPGKWLSTHRLNSSGAWPPLVNVTDPPPPAPRFVSAENSCPRCAKSMTAGFLALGGRANWVSHEGMFDASVFTGDTIVGNVDLLAGTPHLSGWRCENCSLLLLQY
jgi:hypothetical protein